MLFEPDAFDGNDKNFINAEGHDQTGRFIPYWTRGSDGAGVVEALASYEVPGDGDYYQIPDGKNILQRSPGRQIKGGCRG